MRVARPVVFWSTPWYCCLLPQVACTQLFRIIRLLQDDETEKEVGGDTKARNVPYLT